MNRQTWETLQTHGVTDETLLRLDFFYSAPDSDSAGTLERFLRDETDYDVQAHPDSVTGSTQPTSVTPEILDQWVTWMVVAGHENGRCEFDGWGAEVS